MDLSSLSSLSPRLTAVERNDSAFAHSPNAPSAIPAKKPVRPRKSRSAGLRCRTGCITCRKRHKKCDEVQPTCGNCAKSRRNCGYEKQSQPADTSASMSVVDRRPEVPVFSEDSINVERSFLNASFTAPSAEETEQLPQSTAAYQHVCSPQDTVLSTDFLTVDLASVKWLDLLASDAMQEDRGFSLPSSPIPFEFTLDHAYRDSRAQSRDQNIQTSTLPQVDVERLAWQSEKVILLTDNETLIFRNFVERSSLWLDLFDSQKHFSYYATRLALRNVGLMKAILALSARHLYVSNYDQQIDGVAGTNLAVQYYYETLRYIQNALRYDSYASSEELLATTIIISTYEMLDPSGSGWQRHLKGVFWIQRSQNVNGASGGIRQAVWWAWLRQDVWAAFKEKRRALTFWKDTKSYAELNQHELADRSVYLFAQAVNYCAKPSTLEALAMRDSESVERTAEKVNRAKELLAMIESWKSFSGDKYKPLPSPASGGVFPSIWIHPPQFGLALQLIYFAKILVIMNRPAISGINSFLKVQKILSDAISMICGIAVALKDEGCQIISAQCLYGAGLCVQDDRQREEIFSLIENCERRSGWPMSALKTELRAEWEKVDSDSKETMVD